MKTTLVFAILLWWQLCGGHLAVREQFKRRIWQHVAPWNHKKGRKWVLVLFFFPIKFILMVCFLCWMCLRGECVWWCRGMFLQYALNINSRDAPALLEIFVLVWFFQSHSIKNLWLERLKRREMFPSEGKYLQRQRHNVPAFFPSGKKHWMTQGEWWKCGYTSYWNTNNILPFCITHLLDDSCFPLCCQSFPYTGDIM